MATTLRSRLLLTYLLVISVVLCILGGALALYLYRNPYESRLAAQRLRFVSTVLLRRAEQFAGRSTEELQALVERGDETFDVRVAIINRRTGALVDSRAGEAGGLPDLAVLQANQRLVGLSAFRDDQDVAWLFVLRPLPAGDFLLLATPRPSRTIAWLVRDEFFLPFVQAGVIAFLLAVLLSLWVARWVAGPLQRISQAAQQVVAGTYERIPPQGPEEVRRLSQAFNTMAGQVVASQTAQRNLVANVSHELKTPLTSIQGFAQAILDGAVRQPEALMNAAQVIYDEAGRMVRLVQDLLDLARFDAGIARFDFAPISLKGLLEALVERFSRQARLAGVIIRLQLDDLPDIQADADRLTQVFTNLIDNALKYSPRGGEVLVEGRALAGFVEVRVVDGGPGIPVEELDKVFDRFFQLDKSRPGGESRGSGLGLSIAREIVRAHQGTIQTLNNRQTGEAQTGTTLLVRLPLHIQALGERGGG
ncbi:MAG: ATP-binding protein [Anaerolineales bacterium]|nr:ATP-binding protein [Anaerolineales bacterium]